MRRKVKSLSEIEVAINNKSDFQQEIQGKMYELSIVRMLSMSLIEIIQMMKEGRLYIDSEY